MSAKTTCSGIEGKAAELDPIHKSNGNSELVNKDATREWIYISFGATKQPINDI